MNHHLQKIHDISIKKLSRKKKNNQCNFRKRSPHKLLCQRRCQKKKKSFNGSGNSIVDIKRYPSCIRYCLWVGFPKFSYQYWNTHDPLPEIVWMTYTKDAMKDWWRSWKQIGGILRNDSMLYMTFTIHFANESLTLQSFAVKTTIIDSPHTGENLAKEIRKFITEYIVWTTKKIYL